MRRPGPFVWASVGAVIGVGATLAVQALSDDGSTQAGPIPEQVNVAAKGAGKWAASNARPGETGAVYGCEGDEAPVVESRFACHVRFTPAEAEGGREVTLYVVNADRPLVVEVLEGEHHLPYRAAAYERRRP